MIERRERHRRVWHPKEVLTREDQQQDLCNHLSDSNPRRNSGYFRGDFHNARLPQANLQLDHREREEGRLSSTAFKTPPQENISTSGKRPQPAERGAPLLLSDTAVPFEAVQDAMGEIRGYMNQYANCSDPAESAARKERLRQAEAQGQIEESAVKMVKASLAREATEAVKLTPADPEAEAHERIPVAERLRPLNIEPIPQNSPVPINEVDPALCILVTARVGPAPTNELARTTTSEREAQMTQKREPGRPPSRKMTNPSPSPAPGSCSRKRKVAAKPPVARRRPLVEGERPTKVTKAGKTRATHASTPSSSDNIPLARMIPPSAKRKMDFRGQSPPPVP